MTHPDITIERCPHDAANPYTMVRNSLIRDKSISPNCRFILIFLLSNSNNWEIKVSHLINEFEEYFGRDKIYKIINEALDAGYLKREEFSKDGLKRYKYILSETPKFKKCLPFPEKPDTDQPDTENTESKQGTCNKNKQEQVIVCATPGPVAPSSPNEIIKKGFNGKTIRIVKDELIKLAIANRKDWNIQEIEEIWNILVKYENPMRDWFRFCEGTIENQRKIKKIKELDEGKLCKKPKNSQKETLSQPQSNTKETDSENVMPELLLANWREWAPKQHKLPNS